ncbi:MAG: TetR/AcrR family transcriptional regulator [Thermoanaerobaculales bacterium]|jgi:AcrR family transcriptional regulator|nr:TetR/AcrR family transcriptional regulator [Thermoanaerobaculales bacterium]
MTTRSRQKLRTRRALLTAARQILDEGRTPTLADAAERALVSRATVYRYFSSQEALLEELQLDLDFPDEDVLFGTESPPASAADRVSLVRRELYDFVIRNELQYRVFLRNWLDHRLKRPAGDEVETRGARRECLLDRALEPFEVTLGPSTFTRLKIALGVMVGVESMIVLKDIYGLEREQAEEIMDWAVRTLVTAALDSGD